MHIGQSLELKSTAFVVIIIYGHFLLVLMLTSCTRTNKSSKKKQTRPRTRKIRSDQMDDDGVWDYGDTRQNTAEIQSTDGTSTTTTNEKFKRLARRLLNYEQRKRLADKKRRKQKKRQEALERGEKPESDASMSFVSEHQPAPQSNMLPVVTPPIINVPPKQIDQPVVLPVKPTKRLTAPTQDGVTKTKSEKSKKSRRVLPTKKKGVLTPKKSVDPTQRTVTVAEEHTTQDATKNSGKQKQKTKEATVEKANPTITPSAESQTAETNASSKRKKKTSAESAVKSSVDASKISERPKPKSPVRKTDAFATKTPTTTQSPHKDTKSDPKSTDPFASKTPTTTQSPPDNEIKAKEIKTKEVKTKTEENQQPKVSTRQAKSQSSVSSQLQSNQ